MYYLYILSNLKKNWHYIGITKDIAQRIAKHNTGDVRSTRAYRPLQILYTETHIDKATARKREIFLKRTAKARVELIRMIENGLVV